MASIEGRPGDKAHTCLFAVGDHFALFLAVTERVVVLHRHKEGPVVGLGGLLEFDELVGPHAAGA